MNSLFKLALSAVVTIGLATSPTFAQPPPAPTPGVRDHRKDSTSDGITPAEPRQWMIRDINAISPGVEYTIINLRRQYLDLSSKVTFEESPSGFADGTGWGDGGGMWIFNREERPGARRTGPLKEGELVSLYNTRTKRYLRMIDGYFPSWSSKRQDVWYVKHVKTYKDDTVRFALFNREQHLYLGLCDLSLEFHGNRKELCMHEEPRGWRP